MNNENRTIVEIAKDVKDFWEGDMSAWTRTQLVQMLALKKVTCRKHTEPILGFLTYSYRWNTDKAKVLKKELNKIIDLTNRL